MKESGPGQIYPRLAAGDVDISMAFIAPFVVQVEAGAPIVMLAGIHPGCFELFTTGGIHSITELKGKVISAQRRVVRTSSSFRPSSPMSGSIRSVT